MSFTDNDILKFFQGLQPKKRTFKEITQDYIDGKINVRQYFEQMNEVEKNGYRY